MRALAVLGVLLLGACTSTANFGFAVALSMQFDESVSDSALAQVTHIALHVPEEGYSDDMVLGHAAHRTERVVYRPNPGAASLTFELTAESAANEDIAAGQLTVELSPNVTTFAEVVLRAGALPDGGDDGGDVAPTISFVTTPLIATAHQPIGVVIADFNGDGRNDIATASSVGKVQVFLAQANHALPATPSFTSTAAAIPGALAVGDFGGDASPDLVVPDRSTSTLVFLINDGHGNFTPSSVVPATQAGPDSIAVADFDHDGRPDIALGSSTTASIYVYLSMAFYSGPLSYPTTDPVARLRTADFNQDGYYDLIYAEPTANLVGLRMSTSGNFGSQPEKTFAFNAPVDVVTYDTNDDGKPEALLFGQPSATGALLLDNDNGVLAIDANQPFACGEGAALHYAQALDFEGTGVPDIILTHYGVFNGVINGDDSAIDVDRTTPLAPQAFSVASYVSGSAPDAFATGDLNGDGLADIAVVNRNSDTVAIARQLTEGKLYAAPALPFFGAYPRLGDFNGDGKLDLIEADSGLYIYLFPNDGLGNLGSVTTVDANATAVAVGDANEDGIPDLVFGDAAGTLGVALGTSPGVFAAAIYSSAIASNFVDTLLKDVDGDGHLDAVLLNEVNSGNTSGKNVAFARGDGHGGTLSAVTFSALGAVAILISDLDEDGHLDVLALSGTPAQITWLRGQAGGTLLAGPAISTPVSNATSFVTCDVNGDGHVDLVVGGDTLHVLIGDGHGNFTDGGELFGAQPTVAIAAGDADGDGVPEVFAATADSVVRVFRISKGALVPAGVFAAGGFLGGLLSADLTGDHLADLITVGSQVAFLRNDTP